MTVVELYGRLELQEVSIQAVNSEFFLLSLLLYESYPSCGQNETCEDVILGVGKH